MEDRLHTSLETLLSNPPFIHCTNPESGWPKVRRRVITVVDNHNGHCETVERTVLFCRVWKNQDTPREMGRALLVMVVVVSVEQRREAPALPTD